MSSKYFAPAAASEHEPEAEETPLGELPPTNHQDAAWYPHGNAARWEGFSISAWAWAVAVGLGIWFWLWLAVSLSRKLVTLL
jgi:hypothetical protein